MSLIKVLLIQVSCILTVNIVAQGTLDHDYDPTNSSINEDQLYLTEGQLGNPISTYDGYTIYEAAANQNIKNQTSSGLGDLPWRYAVLPKFSIAEVHQPEQLGNDVILDVDIEVSYPDRENLTVFLENSTEDKAINVSDIDYLRVYGYFIHERGRILKKSLSMKTFSPNQKFYASFTYTDMNTAMGTYNRLRRGRNLELSLILNKRELKGGCDFSIISTDILESKAFRDFVSPVIGDTITVDQATEITNSLVKEVSTRVQCKGDFSEEIENLKTRVFNALFSERRVIPFDELAAKGYLVDFDGKRYSPSEFTHFLKEISTENYNQNLDSSYSKSRYVYDRDRNTLVDSKIKGKALFGLVKGDVQTKVDIDRKTNKDELDEKSNKKINTQRNDYTLNLEFDGSVIIPRSFIANEVVVSSNNFIDRFDGSFEDYKQAFQLMTIQISTK